MADRSITISIEGRVGGFTAALKTAQQATRDFGNRTAAFARENEQHMDRVGKAGMLMGGGLLAGVGLAIKSFADFDKAMSEVRASTHETAGNMDLLRTAAINAGADTAFSASEAANAIDEMAKAGVSTKDILGGGLKGALSLAAAGSLGVGDAAELAATAMTQFKLSGSDLPHIADLLAAGAGKAQGSVGDMGAALKQSGLVANMFGISIEETAGSLAAFASEGLTGSDAGTSFKQSLLMLAKPSKDAQSSLDELGISTHDASGKFVGMADLAGQLKEKMGPLTEAQRQQAMATIFGADAIRVASALYDQGAQGIADWTTKVNDAGYAAETAAIKQDNLAGDFEKLTGSLDSVFIKSADGANGALRGLVQGAEDLVDSIGKVPEPVLQAGLGIAGITGGLLLVGGAFTSTLPKIMESVESFGKLEKAAPRTAAALKSAGLIGALFTVAGALGTIQTAITDSEIERSVGRTTTALIELSKQNSNIQQCSILLDDLFQKKDGSPLISGVQDLDSAMTRMFKKDWQQSFSDWGEGLIHGIAPGVKGASQLLDESFKTIDDQLASFVQSGNADLAAKAFKQLEDKAALKGINRDEFKAKFAGYSEALKQADADARVAAEGMEKIVTTTGKIVPITPEAQQALDDLGISAQGAVLALDKYASALVRAGLSNLSVSDAARNVQASIDGVTDSIIKNGSTLDINTAAGRANQAALEGVASAGLQQVETMSKATDAFGHNIYTSDQLQASMYGTYRAMIDAAGQFGITGDAADTLARKALGIPPKVDVKAYLHDFASQQLDNVGIKVANLDGKTAHVYTEYRETTIQKVVRELSGAAEPVGAGSVLAKKAAGGAIMGPGTGTSDDIPAMLSNGEHVLTAAEVARMGGQAAVYRFRALLDAGKLPKFATGGAAEQAKARRNTWIDYQRDSRRGNGYRSVADSLSSAYSFADRLTSLADSGNVSAAAIRNLYTAAGRGEAGLRALHAQSDRVSKSLESAKKRMEDLASVRDSVASKLSGEFSISDAMKNTSPFKAVTLGGIQGSANSVLARIRGFAAKLNKLRAMGYSGAVLEEIAGMGSVEGMVAADALLKGSKAEVKNLNGVYSSIDSASKAAGNYVTDAMYKGGVNAAAGLVKGLQSQEKAIEKQMLKIGLGMETALKRALGIRSPSRKAAAIGDNFTGTLAHRLQAGVSPVAKHAQALGDAMSINPSAVGYRYSPAQAPRLSMSTPSSSPVATAQNVYVQNPFTGEYLLARTATVAQGVVTAADSQSQYTRTGRR